MSQEAGDMWTTPKKNPPKKRKAVNYSWDEMFSVRGGGERISRAAVYGQGSPARQRRCQQPAYPDRLARVDPRRQLGRTETRVHVTEPRVERRAFTT